MVEFGKGPVQEGIDNSLFIIPGIIIVILVGYFSYKLAMSLRNKEKAKEEKKLLKQQRREKEQQRKQKKK